MMTHRVADGIARRIWLVVADDEIRASAPSAAISGTAMRGSSSHRMPQCQGRAKPFITGVKLWIEIAGRA